MFQRKQTQLLALAALVLLAATLACGGSASPSLVGQVTTEPSGGEQTAVPILTATPIPQNLQATIAALQTQVAQPSPIFIETPVPTPTPIVDTPPGSVLSAETHDWWYAGMKGLRPTRVELWAPDQIVTEWEVINLTPNTVVINCSEDSFSVSDNLGRNGAVYTWNGSPDAETVNSGERYAYQGQVVFEINFAQESVTEVMITFSCSGFQNARWRIPIYH